MELNGTQSVFLDKELMNQEGFTINPESLKMESKSVQQFINIGNFNLCEKQKLIGKVYENFQYNFIDRKDNNIIDKEYTSIQFSNKKYPELSKNHNFKKFLFLYTNNWKDTSEIPRNYENSDEIEKRLNKITLIKKIEKIDSYPDYSLKLNMNLFIINTDHPLFCFGYTSLNNGVIDFMSYESCDFKMYWLNKKTHTEAEAKILFRRNKESD